jgi:uncharacterized membrane protein
MTANRSRFIALVTLLSMTALLLWPAPTAWTAFVAAPLACLFLAGLRPPRKWGGWAAVVMVPYFCIALGEVIANPAEYLTAALLAGGAMIVFFFALDFTRRSGISLRR